MDRLEIAYQVYDGGNLDVDFWVLLPQQSIAYAEHVKIAGPDERPIHSELKKTQTTFSFNADQSGKHSYCFSNMMSTVAQKAITFTVHGPDERQKFEEKYKDSTEDFHTPLNEQITRLSNNLHSVFDEQSYMRERGLEDLELNKSDF
ncbi:p24 complex component [Irineochytrium annulatum]|nr:p24 complex component [Irineochytrium annulatum]